MLIVLVQGLVLLQSANSVCEGACLRFVGAMATQSRHRDFGIRILYQIKSNFVIDRVLGLSSLGVVCLNKV